MTYSGLPPYVLRELIANRLLRTRAGGTLIQRASIDEILAESVYSPRTHFLESGPPRERKSMPSHS